MAHAGAPCKRKGRDVGIRTPHPRQGRAASRFNAARDSGAESGAVALQDLAVKREPEPRAGQQLDEVVRARERHLASCSRSGFGVRSSSNKNAVAIIAGGFAGAPPRGAGWRRGRPT